MPGIPWGWEVEFRLYSSLWEGREEQEGVRCGPKETFSFFLGLLPPWPFFLLSLVHPSDLEAGEIGLWGPWMLRQRLPHPRYLC